MDPLVWEKFGTIHWTTPIDWKGFRARWLCNGDSTMVLWVYDNGEPGGCEPYELTDCECPECSQKEGRQPGRADGKENPEQGSLLHYW